MTDGETSEEEEELKNLCDDSSDDSLAEDKDDEVSKREEFINILFSNQCFRFFTIMVNLSLFR